MQAQSCVMSTQSSEDAAMLQRHLWRKCAELVRPLQENLRQLCVYKLGNESNESYRWWEYVTKFADECTMSENNYNEECAERVSLGPSCLGLP